MRKRLLSALLAMAMMLTMLPVSALAAGEGEATVKVDGKAAGETALDDSDGVHKFVATEAITSSLLFVKSGEGEGTNATTYGYWPSINMPTPGTGDVYVLYRMDSAVENKTTLQAAIKEFAKGADDSKSTGATNEVWYELVKGDKLGTYWPTVRSFPSMNIIWAKAPQTEGNDYELVTYTFDFSDVTIDLPFTLSGVTNADLKAAGLQDADLPETELSENVAVDDTVKTLLGTKEVGVKGTSNLATFPWFSETDNEGYFVAMKLALNDQIKTDVRKVTYTLSDNTTVKELDADGILIWKLDENKSNATIPVKVVFQRDANDESKDYSITYNLKLNSVTLDDGTGDIEISEVAITLNKENLKVGSALPEAKTETEGVSLETNWYKAGNTETAVEAFDEAGNYVAKITVKADTGYALKPAYTVTVNGQAATADQNNVITVSDVVVANLPSTLAVTVAEGTLTDLGDKAVADLQSGLTIANPDKDNVIKVTGISKYVESWPQFSSNVDQQKGNYVALKLESSKVDEKVSIKKNGAWVALDSDRILVVLLDGPSNNKVEVALGDTTPDTKAAYTIDLTGMTKNTSDAATTPTVKGMGFEAVGADAVTAIGQLGGNAADCEANTMFVRYIGLTEAKHYKVVFTDSKNETVYDTLVQVGETDHEITGTKTATAYFTFTGNGSKPVTGKTLASGVYTAKLYEKTEDAQNPWKEVTVEGTASVELHKLTVKNGATTVSETYYQSTKTVDAPAALENTATAAFKGWKNGSEIVTSVAMTADVTLEAVFENYVIDADTLVATADGAALKAEITTAADGKKTIAISGMAPEGTTEITLKYKLNKADAAEEIKTVAVNPAKDGFTATTTEIAATEAEKYAVSVAGITVSAKVADPAPVVTVGKDIKPEDTTTVETAAKSTTITEISDLVAENNEAVNQTVQSVSNAEKETAVTALNALDGVTGVTTNNVELVVQPVMDVKPTAYDATTAKTFTLEVTAAYRVVAVKEGTRLADIKVNDAGVADANAVVVKKPVPMEVETSVTIVVNLPAAIGAKEDGTANTPIPVLHEKTETDKHYHTATVEKDESDPTNPVYTATVVSSDGLSPFTFDASVNLVAEVNGKSYTTLADAIAAVENNGTIKLLANVTEEVKVARAIVFTVDVNGKTGADNIVAADGYKLVLDEETHTYTFTKNSTSGGMGPMGGGSGATTYSVNVPTTEHGTVTVNPRNAAKDATVTITVSPNQGYILDTLTVTDKDGNNIELTKVDSNKYTFKMPASRVEIKASFKEGTAPADGGFTDITSGEYYYDAVLWAVDKGITTGLTETTFGPNASCTRAQMVTFLWRAAGSPEPTATTTAFTDIDANEYYYKAVLWAVEKGITTGATETTFAPNATVTRAQTVTFLYRYAGKPAVSGNNNFTDLEAGEYYVDAVQWAATNGITTGTTETTFSPANNCTRGQIVTFLYRHIVK